MKLQEIKQICEDEWHGFTVAVFDLDGHHLTNKHEDVLSVQQAEQLAKKLMAGYKVTTKKYPQGIKLYEELFKYLDLHVIPRFGKRKLSDDNIRLNRNTI